MKKILSTNLFFLIILFIVIFLVYGKSINFKLTNLDDNLLTIKNIDFISNYKNIPNFFLTDCYFGKETQYYRPILNISFSIESILFKYNLKVYHTTNILLFIFSLYFIFLFVSKLNFNNTILKFLILSFAVHPALSSVPVWIPSRNDTLLTIFFMISLINFINYLKTNRNFYLFIHLLFFTISLFTKETTILLLFIYPLLIYCFDLKFSKKQVISNVVYIIFLLFIYFTFRHYAINNINILTHFNNIPYYLQNIFIGLMFYIEKIIYPTYIPIMLYDLHPNIQIYILSLIVILSLIHFYYKKIIKIKIIIFSLTFSFLAILPTFLQEDYAFFTHRLTTCLTGIIILLAVIIEKMILENPKIKNYLIIIFTFLFILFSFCSFIQINKYKNSLTFWSNAYKDANNYYIACSSLANEHLCIGNYKIAKELYYQSKKLKNTYQSDLDICTVLIAEGNITEAKDRLLKLLQLKENFTTLRYLSEIYYVEGDINKSLEYAKNAYKLSKNDKLLLKHLNRLPNFDYNI